MGELNERQAKASSQFGGRNSKSPCARKVCCVNLPAFYQVIFDFSHATICYVSSVGGSSIIDNIPNTKTVTQLTGKASRRRIPFLEIQEHFTENIMALKTGGHKTVYHLSFTAIRPEARFIGLNIYKARGLHAVGTRSRRI